VESLRTQNFDNLRVKIDMKMIQEIDFTLLSDKFANIYKSIKLGSNPKNLKFNIKCQVCVIFWIFLINNIFVQILRT
jgi:hypothetical protein